MSERKTSSNLINIISQIVIWLLLLQLVYDLLGLLESFVILFLPRIKFIDDAFLVIPSLIVLFYWNSHFLIPKFLNAESWWKYLIFLTLSFLFPFFAGVFLFDLFLMNGYESNFEETAMFFDHSLLLHLIIVGVSASMGVSKIAMVNAKQKKQAEKMQKEAEMKYLNSQINPHFLYNTLNGIYAQALEENAGKTTELILRLSEIMRYPLNNVVKEAILLSEEITFVENFIALQKLRLGDDYPIVFRKTGNSNQLIVIPFIIIPFVENAFKYGISQKDKASIFFSLKIEQNNFIFQSENKIVNTKDIQSHLIGISNLKSRLKLKYGENYSLKILEDGQNYIVELRIKLSLS